ncbi:hypothetical protein MBEHAL_0543 [Halarchaeum acidiphilum MH1-52-1]|uniref:Uncharacterized protein n=1 Tax=Halarchaeum acidiphilum MH1-52-1 TaxID=1261545 RepID=U3AAJ0_9EURY|nr:DUF6149 family protein [Halarchaeum acidiphilum]GAD51783.1 hypothetical protein MBEHAL_0543 [Halarchaeum acidiphilum MH1-52-1]
MKLRQNVSHFAARKALELPGVGDLVHEKLVDIHVSVFSGWADPEYREERIPHLEAFFDASTEMYLTALQEGCDEATAREITHIVGTFDFYDHGWAEMMEFPPAEVDAHYERHRDFFERHGITVEDPLGEFAPADGLPAATATPERLEDGDFPHATGGFADDVYVEDGDGETTRGSQDAPNDVDVNDAPGAK